MKNGSETERYDSVRNEGSTQHIIYDSNKQYPAYLITYNKKWLKVNVKLILE